MKQKFYVDIKLKLSGETILASPEVNQIPKDGLKPGDEVIFRITSQVDVSNGAILVLMVAESNHKYPTQAGALVSTWSLLRDTRGIVTTTNGIYLTITTTDSASKVTVLNGNMSKSFQTCFVTLVGTAEFKIGESVYVGAWCLDPEILLQSGGDKALRRRSIKSA